MEPENTPLEEENHLPMPIIFKFYVNLPGCTPLFLNGKFSPRPLGPWHFRTASIRGPNLPGPLRPPTTHCVAGRTCSGFKAAWVPESQGGNPPTPRVCEVHHLYKQVETTTMWPAPKGDFLSHKIGTYITKLEKCPPGKLDYQLSIFTLEKFFDLCFAILCSPLCFCNLLFYSP